MTAPATAIATVAELETAIRITFTKPNRHGHTPKPVTTTTDEATAAQAIVGAMVGYYYSTDIDAIFNWADMTGKVLAGFRTINEFNIEHLAPEVWL